MPRAPHQCAAAGCNYLVPAGGGPRCLSIVAPVRENSATPTPLVTGHRQPATNAAGSKRCRMLTGAARSPAKIVAPEGQPSTIIALR